MSDGVLTAKNDGRGEKASNSLRSACSLAILCPIRERNEKVRGSFQVLEIWSVKFE